MRKTYRYKNLSYAVADDKDVYFAIKFVSDGNKSHTIINIPGNNDPVIENSGLIFIGKGKDLRGETTVSFTDVENPLESETEIRIRFLIGEEQKCNELLDNQLTDEQLNDAKFLNGQIFVEHFNSKAPDESQYNYERPYVVLLIKFP